jgi:hypothetical protein
LNGNEDQAQDHQWLEDLEGDQAKITLNFLCVGDEAEDWGEDSQAAWQGRVEQSAVSRSATAEDEVVEGQERVLVDPHAQDDSEIFL